MKWYQRSLIIVLLTFLLFPVGLILLYRYKKTWYSKARLTVAGIGAAIFIIQVGAVLWFVNNRPQYVWVDSTAGCYHTVKNCSNMDHSYRVSLDEALDLGKRPCKDCVQR